MPASAVEAENDFTFDFEKDGRALTEQHASAFPAKEHFEHIYIRYKNRFLVKDARKFTSVRSVSNITVWCDVTRAAVRFLISRPHLADLTLLSLKPPGRLVGFDEARDVRSFSCHDLLEDDLLEIAKLASFQKLRAHMAELTEKSMSALLAKPLLAEVDFEDSNFDDRFASMISGSRTITSLEIGATRLTKLGLARICAMTQLKALDIWATDIGEPEIDLLQRLPNLEYLSIGGHDEQTVFSAGSTLPKLYEMPSLKTVWLDGFHVTRRQWQDLNDRYEKVWVTSILDD